MVRNRKRTTSKASWTGEELAAALAAIRDGEKIREVGRRFGIHEATLRKRLKQGVIGGPKMGTKTVFTEKQEKELASHLLRLANLFYGVTLIELRRIAYEFAEKNKLKNSFNQETKLAGKDWAQGFLRRNPNLSLRKPEPTSVSRILAFNKAEVDRFFNNLMEVTDRYKFTPARIFNVDETGISTVQKPPSIIGPKGQKQLGTATSLERGRNITVCCAMSATGIFIPPMFIYPGVRMSPGLSRGGPAGSIYACSKSGWMNEELFLRWLRHFAENTQTSVQNPTLLLMDNHSSHTSLMCYNFCKDNGIVVVSFPPHTSHRLQPLDVAFYGPLKSAYNRECGLFMRNHPYQRICREDVPCLFNAAYTKVAGVDKAVSGFSKPGIFPVNPDVFTEEDFIPATQMTPVVADVESETGAGTLETVPRAGPYTTRPTGEDDASVSGNGVSILDISPIPVRTSTSSETRISGRPKQHSEILTSTPRKNQLEEAEKKKEEKKSSVRAKVSKNKTGKNKGRQQSKRILFQGDTSSSDEMLDERNICDDEISDDDMEGMLSRLPQSNNTNDICLFCGEFGRNKELWFRCVVCSGWVHAECSGEDSAVNFKCDSCQ